MLHAGRGEYVVAEILVPRLARHLLDDATEDEVPAVAVVDAGAWIKFERPLLQIFVGREIRQSCGMAQQIRDADLIAAREPVQVFQKRIFKP